MKLLLRTLTACGVLLAISGAAQAQSEWGRLSGIVSDPTGAKQMGATVLLTAEALGDRTPTQLRTDRNGAFAMARVRPGLYSVKVSLAGFLPAIQEHIRITSNLTTMVHVELGSVFASLDALRQAPDRPSEDDDWQWVLRTSAATRPVLHALEPTITVSNQPEKEDAEDPAQPPRPRGRIEMASGSLHPGSFSGLAGPAATAGSYDQSLGPAGRMMVAGRMSYVPDLGAGATFAGVWLPAGEFDQGPETVVVLRQARFAPASGQSFRSLRAAHTERMQIGNTAIEYGTAYLMAGTTAMNSTLRPRFRVRRGLSPKWSISYSMETEPDSQGLHSRGALQSALDALDTLPVIIWADGRGTIAGNWHYELALHHDVGKHRSIEAAAFRDTSSHTAIFGFDLDDPNGPKEPPIAPYAHDGGRSRLWGSRVVYKEKVSDAVEVAAIYSMAGALTPASGTPTGRLSDSLETQLRHSLAARVSGDVPFSHTQVAASYKWISGPVVSRQDLFGEAALGIDPNLSLSVKQPLPSFGTGHWEALADFRNVFAQGYVPVDQKDGRMLLTPVARSFRGGVSFQF